MGSSNNRLIIVGNLTIDGQAGVIRTPNFTSSDTNLCKHLEMRGMGGNMYTPFGQGKEKALTLKAFGWLAKETNFGSFLFLLEAKVSIEKSKGINWVKASKALWEREYSWRWEYLEKKSAILLSVPAICMGMMEMLLEIIKAYISKAKEHRENE